MPNTKRIFFYCAVVKLSISKRIYPIYSMISSKHNSNMIFKILHDFHYYWPSFSGIVTDFSFANLHVICKAFNRCTLLEYLEKCYSMIECKKIGDEGHIGVFLCCAHYMKMPSKDIDTFATNNEQSLYFKDLLASAILIHDINHCNNRY